MCVVSVVVSGAESRQLFDFSNDAAERVARDARLVVKRGERRTRACGLLQGQLAEAVVGTGLDIVPRAMLRFGYCGAADDAEGVVAGDCTTWATRR